MLTLRKNSLKYKDENGVMQDSGVLFSSGVTEVDTTLSESGMAADAKTVGDELDKLSEDISNLKENGTGAVQSDWNQNDETSPDYVKNRTHYDSRYTEQVDNSFNFTFDGNLEGREYIEIIPDYLYFVKLSDTPLEKEQIIGSTIKIQNPDGNESNIIEEDCIINGETYIDVYNGMLFSVFEDSVINDTSFNTGLWIPSIENTYTSSFSKTAIETVERGELKQIDEKYIPDTIARTDSILQLYDKVITISETREFIDPIIDKEFAQLLYENRHTALYTVGGKSFTFSNDEASPMGYSWTIISDDGETNMVNIIPSAFLSDPSNTESTVYDTILGARNTVFTVNYEKVVRLIDEKFLPEHSWNNLEDKPFGEWENETILEEHIVNVENNWANISGLQSLELIDNQNTNYYIYFDDELRDAFVAEDEGAVFIISDTNGEAPVIVRNGMDNSLIIDGFPDGEHRVKIVARTKYFKQLDEKYISDTIARTNYVNEKTSQLNENINQISENTNQLSENINQLNEKTDQLSEEVQNLPKNYNDLKDKPLGDVTVTEVLSEAVVTSVSDESYVSDSAKNKFYSANVKLPSAEYIVGEEYIVEINGEIHRLTVCRQYEMQNGCYNTGFNVDSNISCYFEPKPIVGATFCIYAYDLGNSDTFTSELWIQLTKDVTLPATIKIMKELNGIKQIDEKYIPELSSVILKSTTENSTKKFKITVDDNGTLSATEVTN